MGERRYVAGRDQLVDGQLRQVGEPVPEAAGWTNLAAYLSAGWIVVQVDEDAPAAMDPIPLSSFLVAPAADAGSGADDRSPAPPGSTDELAPAPAPTPPEAEGATRRRGARRGGG